MVSLVINSKYHSDDRSKLYQNPNKMCNEFPRRKGNFVNNFQTKVHLNE